MSNFINERIKKLKENILRTKRTVQEFVVYCPHCAEEQDSTEVWESGLNPNGNEHEYECSSCEKEFLITADVVFSTEIK